MRYAFISIPVAALSVVGGVRSACLLSDYSVQAEFNRSEAVVVGKVVAERTVPDAEQPEVYGGVIYTVAIEQSYRGQLRKNVELFSENTSGRFPMKRGTRYLLFLSRDGSHLSADNCGNSGPTSEKEAVVVEIRRLAE
jgi:hypothetical protein